MSKYFLWLPSLLGACLIAMMQVGPSEAGKNLCDWITKIFASAEGECVAIPHLTKIIWGAATLLVLITVFLLLRRVKIRQENYPSIKRVRSMQLLGWIIVIVSAMGVIIGLSMVARAAEILQSPKGYTAASKEYARHRVLGSARSSDVQIEYMNESNADYIETLFRRSHFLISSGNTIDRRISFHRYYVGIKNASKDRTLRNARLTVHMVGLGGIGGFINKGLWCERTDLQSADVAPQSIEYFLLGRAFDETDVGMFHPKIVSASDYEIEMGKVAQLEHNHSNFILETRPPRTILRNDGIKLELHAVADDALPVNATFRINTKAKVEVILEDVKGLDQA